MAEELPGQYYLALGGKALGPYTEAEIRSFIENGAIEINTNVQLVGTGSWQSLNKFPQFQECFVERTPPTLEKKQEVFEDEGPCEIMMSVAGQQHGPYTVGQIRHGAKTGTIDGDTPAKRPGMPGWVPLRNWKEFEQIHFAYKAIESDEPEVDIVLECSGPDNPDIKEGYKWAALALCCCAPLALVCLYYGIRNIINGAIIHGIIQIMISLISLLFWVVAVGMQLG
ncbi:MAG: GYF domain-containing protein [Verrucomicrobiota bacterium]|jgi:hypothetical protein|nr:GYF domain-containing protein [Verrucomicrobiota bacterium]